MCHISFLVQMDLSDEKWRRMKDLKTEHEWMNKFSNRSTLSLWSHFLKIALCSLFLFIQPSLETLYFKHWSCRIWLKKKRYKLKAVGAQVHLRVRVGGWLELAHLWDINFDSTCILQSFKHLSYWIIYWFQNIYFEICHAFINLQKKTPSFVRFETSPQ